MFDIKFNVNVKRKFKVNGVEYNSIEEMPENVRENFKKTMAAMAGSKQGINLAVSRTKISFNGAEYDGPDAMPPDARQLYEKALKAALKINPKRQDAKNYLLQLQKYLKK